MLDYGESHGWDSFTISDIIGGGKLMAMTTYRIINDTLNGTYRPSEPTKSVKATTEDKTSEPKPVTFKVIKQTPIVREEVNKAETVVKAVAEKVREEYTDLVERAEAAIAGKPYPPAQEVPIKNDAAETASTEEVPVPENKIKIYDAPLPLECEPPPGFSRPPPPKSKFDVEPKSKTEQPESKPVALPLVAPALALASEPIISHLAGAIDNLATYLKSDPKAAEQASDVLELAKSDLTALVERIEVVKEQERTTLEAKMDEQTREYTLKLMEMEMEGQDKLENQEHEFRIFFEQERARFIQAYREKLDHELRVQTELINERYVTIS
jgi:MICOS complex subunit MIC60